MIVIHWDLSSFETKKSCLTLMTHLNKNKTSSHIQTRAMNPCEYRTFPSLFCCRLRSGKHLTYSMWRNMTFFSWELVISPRDTQLISVPQNIVISEFLILNLFSTCTIYIERLLRSYDWFSKIGPKCCKSASPPPLPPSTLHFCKFWQS